MAVQWACYQCRLPTLIETVIFFGGNVLNRLPTIRVMILRPKRSKITMYLQKTNGWKIAMHFFKFDKKSSLQKVFSAHLTLHFTKWHRIWKCIFNVILHTLHCLSHENPVNCIAFSSKCIHDLRVFHTRYFDR